MGDWAAIETLFATAKRRRCADSGCEFRVAGVHDVLVLKGEEIGEADRMRADCLVFAHDAAGRAWVFVVELKSKSVSVSEVEEKLRNSAADAREALTMAGLTADVRYLLLTKAGLKRDDRRLLERLRFSPGRRMLQRADCGYLLSKALADE